MPALAQSPSTCYKCNETCTEEELQSHMIRKCTPSALKATDKKSKKILENTTKKIEMLAQQQVAKDNHAEHLKPQAANLQKVLAIYQNPQMIEPSNVGYTNHPINPYTMMPHRNILIQMVLAPQQVLDNSIGNFHNTHHRNIKITIEEV